MEQTSRLSIVIDTGNAQRDLQNLRRALADLERSGEKTGKGMGDVGNNAKGLSADIDKAVKNISGGMQKIGAVSGVGLAAVSFGIKNVADEAKKFEFAMAGVKKVIDFDSPEAFKKMGDDILALSQKIPMAADGLADIMASAGQAGIAQADLFRFTETAAKMGVAFDISAQEAGQAMAEMRVAFNMSQAEVETLADKINYLGNTSPNNASKIMEVVQRVGSLGGVAGVSSDQIAALAGSITAVAPEVMATGLKNMMLALTKGEGATKSQRIALEELGLKAEQVAKSMQMDSMGTFIDVVERIKKLPKELQVATINDIFGSEALPVIAQLVENTDALKTNLQAMGDSSKYAGSMLKEFEGMAGTSQAQTELFSNNITALKIALGSALLPVINDIMLAFTPMLQAFTEWASTNPALISTITIVMTAILGLGTVLGTIGVAIPAIVTGFGLLISPIGLAVAGITALIAIGIALYQHWDVVKAKAMEVWNAIPLYAEQAWQWIQNVWQGVQSWFSGIFSEVEYAVMIAWDNIKLYVQQKFDEIKQSFVEWLGGMPQPVQEMVANIVSIFHGLVSATQTIWAGMVAVSKLVSLAVIATWQGLTAIFASIWQGFVDIAKTAWDIVVSITKPVIETLVGIVKTGLTVIVSVWQAQFTAIKLVAGVVFEGIKAVVGGGINAIKAIFTAGLTVFASVFNTGFALIKNIFTTTFAVIKALVRGDMEGVKTAIFNGIQNAWNIVKTGIGNIVREFAGLGAKLKQAGIDAIQGLINGIGSKFDAVREKVSQIAGLIPDGVRSLLNIRSPSRVMRELGAWAGEGFVLGVGDKVKDAKQVAQDLANALTNTITELHRQEFMLKNHANPLAEWQYKVQFGELAELTDKQKARVLELARANLDLAKANDINKSISDEIASIDEKLQTHGMNRLEILQWQITNTEKYKEANEELLATLKNQIQVEGELNQLFRTREKLKGYQDSLAKNTYLYRTKGDKYAGERWDLSQQGFDGKYIEQMIETLRQSDVMSAMANMPKTLTMPTLQNNNVGSAVSSAVTGYFDLKKQLDDNLAIIKEAENAKLITEQESQLARLEQERAFHEARQNLVMAGADNILGSMANATKAMLGEQSSAYRAMFALQQSFAIGTAIVNIHKAISDAFAEGTTLAQKFAGVATATTQGMKIVSAIQQIRNPVIGQAHDGIMSVPKSGTWNLEKGERVLPKHTAKALDDRLDNMGGGQVINVHVTVNSDGSNVQADTQMGKSMGNAIKLAVQAELQKERRQGGLLYR